MEIEQLQALVKLTELGGLAVLELRRPGGRVRLEGGTQIEPETAPLIAAVAPRRTTTQVTAPGFGQLVTQHPLRSDPFVTNGSVVEPGDILALIQVDELYLPVTSHDAGSVRSLTAAQGLVGYGAPLFEIDT
jgi:biotin carboxyl carrier protein